MVDFCQTRLEVLYAAGKAERVDGGYRFFGHKHFGSLTPVWNWLKIYGFDAADPDDPKIVHGVMARDAAGYRIVETWDTLGMRATASHDTVIEGTFVPDRNVIRVVARVCRCRRLRPWAVRPLRADDR